MALTVPQDPQKRDKTAGSAKTNFGASAAAREAPQRRRSSHKTPERPRKAPRRAASPSSADQLPTGWQPLQVKVAPIPSIVCIVGVTVSSMKRVSSGCSLAIC